MYEWYPDKGNPVTPVPMGTVGDGPAAVIGDETCDKPLPFDKLRVGRRKK